MIMLFRHTALRVSDVTTFRKDAVSWDPEVGHTAATAGRCSRLPLLLLERGDFSAGRGRNRGADTGGRI
jgi:hypothetical protein